MQMTIIYFLQKYAYGFRGKLVTLDQKPLRQLQKENSHVLNRQF